jgi:SAM-dependent methyltransferase
MHNSSLRLMRRSLKQHFLPDPVLSRRESVRVLDVGGADVNGSYRQLFDGLGATVTTVDIAVGSGVDTVLDDPYQLPFESESFDMVCSGQTFEHSPRFWDLFTEMCRVARSDGLIVVIAPSAGDEHRYPVDCYRFLPDALPALAEHAGVHLVEGHRDEVGPFHDVVGVFRKQLPTAAPVAPDPARWRALDDTAQNDDEIEVVPEREVRRGAEPALDFLARLHRELAPRGYIETGVWWGMSLVLAGCPAVGIDPYPDLQLELGSHARVAEMTAEDYFAFEDVRADLEHIDLAYVDGLHLLEHALMDFMQIERHAHPTSIILIDDIYPNHPAQASRRRSTKNWTGDVWKSVFVLTVLRPDLLLVPVDTAPTGTLMVIGADPTNTTLWDGFDAMIAQNMPESQVGEWALTREGSLRPDDPLLWRIVREVRRARDRGDERLDVDRLRAMLADGMPRSVVAS